VGKLFAAAKRKVLFKFAFEGDTDEHAVVLMHTLNSGKKVLFVNGEEKHAEEKVRSVLLWRAHAPRRLHTRAPPPPLPPPPTHTSPPAPQLEMGSWKHPFNLADHLGVDHLLVLSIEAQLDVEGQYDLSIDGRPFADMRTITLSELRTKSRGGGGGARNAGEDDAWGRSGALQNEAPAARRAAPRGGDGGGGWGAEPEAEAEEAPSYRGPGAGRKHGAAAVEAEAAPVPTFSMNAFVGGGGGSGGGGGGGDSWDPFGGAGASDAADFADFGAAPAAAPPPVPPRAPAAAAKVAAGVGAALKPPAAAAAPAARAAPAPAADFDPFGAAPAAPAARPPSSGKAAGAPAASGSLLDDLAGLSLGGGGGGGDGFGGADPFGAAPTGGGGGGGDLFGGSFAPAAAPAKPPQALTGAAALVDLDNLTAQKTAAPANAKPSLAQLASSKACVRTPLQGAPPPPPLTPLRRLRALPSPAPSPPPPPAPPGPPFPSSPHPQAQQERYGSGDEPALWRRGAGRAGLWLGHGGHLHDAAARGRQPVGRAAAGRLWRAAAAAAATPGPLCKRKPRWKKRRPRV
jgi:hypothetical protein